MFMSLTIFFLLFTLTAVSFYAVMAMHGTGIYSPHNFLFFLSCECTGDLPNFALRFSAEAEHLRSFSSTSSSSSFKISPAASSFF